MYKERGKTRDRNLTRAMFFVLYGSDGVKLYNGAGASVTSAVYRSGGFARRSEAFRIVRRCRQLENVFICRLLSEFRVGLCE